MRKLVEESGSPLGRGPGAGNAASDSDHAGDAASDSDHAGVESERIATDAGDGVAA